MTLKDVSFKSITGLKKTVVYSNEREKAFMEGALSILSVANKKTPSAILEDLVEQALLPENETAKKICKQLYSSEINNVKALGAVFDIYAAGLGGFEARYTNGFELVEFFHSNLVMATYPTDEQHKGDRKHFLANFKEIVAKIEHDKTSDDEDSLNTAESPVKYAKFELEEATNEPDFFKPINFTQLLKNHWDILGNYTYTYRALVAMCNLLQEQIGDYAEERIELVEIIRKVSKEWK